MDLTDEQKSRLLAVAQRKKAEREQATKAQNGWGARIKDAASETAEDLFVMADQATNAATFGGAGQLYRHAGALGEMIRSDDDTMGYRDFLAEVDKERAARRDANPISAFTGTVAGAMLPTGGAANAIGGGVIKRLAAATGLGAAQNVGIDMGNAELDTLADAGQSAAIGGAGGLIGQALGEVISPAIRGARGRLTEAGIEQTAKRQVGESLFDHKAGQGSLRAALYGDKAMSEADILADVAKRKTIMDQTGRMFGETDPAILKVTEGLTAHPAVTGMTKEVGEVASRRIGEVDENIVGTLMDHLTDSNRAVTGADAATDALTRRQAASKVFAEILDSPEGASVPVMSKSQFIRQANMITDDAGKPIFDLDNATSTLRNSLKRFVDEVDHLGAGQRQKGITLKGMHNVKGEIDGLIRSTMRGADTGPERLAVRDLVELKNYVKGALNQADGRYAEAAAKFGDASAYDDLAKLGHEYMSGSLTGAKAGERARYLASLDPTEKGAFQDGALNWLKAKLESSPNYLRTLSSNKGEQGKIAEVFGDAVASNATTMEDLTKMVGESFAARGMYGNIARNAANAPANAGKPLIGNEGALTDIASIITKGGSGHFNSSTITNALRRIMTSHPEKTPQVMMDLMRQESPEAVQTLIDEILALRKLPNASLRSGSAGSGVAAGLSTILD